MLYCLCSIYLVIVWYWSGHRVGHLDWHGYLHLLLADLLHHLAALLLVLNLFRDTLTILPLAGKAPRFVFLYIVHIVIVI